MKLFQLSKPGLRLLYISLVLTVLMHQGCTSDKNDSPETENVTEKNAELMNTILRDSIQKHLGMQVHNFVTGQFTNSSTASIAFVQKYDTKDIKNVRIVVIDSLHFAKSKAVQFQTEALEGEPESVKLEILRFNDNAPSLLYFNTSDYLMGSSGGEIYHYIIDPANKRTYFAHFIADKRQGLLLYIPSQPAGTSLRNYFIDRVKQNYPEVKLSKYDIAY